MSRLLSCFIYSDNAQNNRLKFSKNNKNNKFNKNNQNITVNILTDTVDNIQQSPIDTTETMPNLSFTNETYENEASESEHLSYKVSDIKYK